VSSAPAVPVNLDAEESVLGAMMTSRHAIVDCAEILNPKDFWRETHANIFRAIVDLDLEDRPADAITVVEKLTTRGQITDITSEHVHHLQSLYPVAGNAAHYARIVRDHSQLRDLIRAGNDVARLGYERPGEVPELVEQAEQIVFDLANDRSSGDLRHLSDGLVETHQRMVATQHAAVTGAPTGIQQLDVATAGLQPGNLIILAARPSMGKSALAITAAHHLAGNAGRPVAIFSLEMSKPEVEHRMLAIETGLQLRNIRQSSRLRDMDWTKVADGFERLSRLPVFVDDTAGLRVMEIRSRARRLKAKQPDLALIIVDYLQLMLGGADRWENRVQEVSQISRGLKILARDLEIPVLALSQLSREVEKRPDKRPILSDLRDSGSIEQDADLVLFVYRDAYYKKQATPEEHAQAELIMAKHRNGPTGTVNVRWDGARSMFKDETT